MACGPCQGCDNSPCSLLLFNCRSPLSKEASLLPLPQLRQAFHSRPDTHRPPGRVAAAQICGASSFVSYQMPFPFSRIPSREDVCGAAKGSLLWDHLSINLIEDRRPSRGVPAGGFPRKTPSRSQSSAEHVSPPFPCPTEQKECGGSSEQSAVPDQITGLGCVLESESWPSGSHHVGIASPCPPPGDGTASGNS